MKILIIGIDGVTWNVFTDDILKKHMPTLHKLKGEGTSGVLTSTVPPVTPAAWTTMTNGCLPYKNGLTNFYQYQLASNRYSYSSASIVKLPSMWHYFGEKKIKSASINVPFTFPIKPAKDHIAIAGLGCPGINSDFVSPLVFKEKLLNAIPNYAVGLGPDAPEKKHNAFSQDKKTFQDAINRFANIFEQRLQAAQLIQQEQNPEVLMVQFQQLDLLQHLCWPYIAANTRDQYPWQRDTIFELYRKLDIIIAKLCESFVSSETTLTIASDHGFGPYQYTININKLLMDWGYIHRSGPIKRLIRRSKRNLMKYQKGREKSMTLDLKWPIDLAKTRAMVLLDPTMGILYINQKNRQPGGCVEPGEEYHQLVEELKCRLEKLTNPYNDEKVFSQVVRPQDLYEPFENINETLGDLLLFQKPNYQISKTMKTNIDLFEKHEPTDLTAAWHHPDGMYILNGPGIKSGFSHNACIEDIAPTIYTSLNMEIPAEVDGTPMSEAFEVPPQYQKKSQIKFPSTFSDEHVSDSASEEEQSALEEQLKNLGYL
jgi:predicted AlkP superfamily phosphohydrolase/phosphomutase